MAIDTPFILGKKSQDGLLAYCKNLHLQLNNEVQIRTQLEAKDRLYMREPNLGEAQRRARTANAYGDKSKIQDVTVPIVMPQVESSVGYLTSVFLSGYPIFSMAAGPDSEDEALMYNSIIGENSIRGGWTRELIMFFRDGLKYDIHGLEVEWCEKKIYSVETDQASSLNEGKRKELLWKGNVLKRMDMYNTFFDKTVAIPDIHSKGDFAGYTELYSRIALKTLIDSFPDGMISPETINDAFNSGSPTAPGGAGMTSNYYIPTINPEPLVQMSSYDGVFDWDRWAADQQPSLGRRVINYKNCYEVIKHYIRIIPNDFSMTVPQKKSPQIWCIWTVNDEVVLYAKRMTNAHNYLPIVFGQPLEDGLRFNTKSFADNIAPYQDISSALWNERLNSARRRITDRALYNPNLIRKEDINSPEPNAKIPVKNSAYGRNLQEAIYVWPFNDANAGMWSQESNAVVEMSYFASGRNRVAQGQFQKGNKTMKEFDATMANSNSRDQTQAMFIEAQVFTPVKEMVKLNILQYQPKGEVYNYETQQAVVIDPLVLRKKALEFKVSDGLSPQDKMMSTDEFSVALQTMQAVPAIAAGYEIVPAFSYMMKLRGLDGLQKFEKTPLKVAWEQQLSQWQNMAMMAIDKGVALPPQPQMPPALVQEMQNQAALQNTAAQENLGNAPVAAGGGSSGLNPQQQVQTQQSQPGSAPQ